jgi:hypothetical protein
VKFGAELLPRIVQPSWTADAVLERTRKDSLTMRAVALSALRISASLSALRASAIESESASDNVLDDSEMALEEESSIRIHTPLSIATVETDLDASAFQVTGI